MDSSSWSQYDDITKMIRVPYVILYLSLLALIIILYQLLFPARVGDTSRISFFDRIALAFRLAFARISLFVNPIKEVPLKSISSSSPLLLAATFFNSAEEAIETVLQSSKKDKDNNNDKDHVFYFSGFAATESPFVWFKALSKLVSSSSSSSNFKNITVISQTGSSLRGVGSTSLDNFIAASPPGTVKKIIVGHLETLRGTLRRVETEHKKFLNKKNTSNKGKDDDGVENLLQVYNLPLGVISRLVGLQNNNQNENDFFGPSLTTTVGLGTFLEKPNGHKVTPYSCEWNLAETTIKRCISYKLPKITTTFLHAKIADRKGNVYFFENTLIGDAYDAAMAAKKQSRGKVFVSVEKVITNDEEMEKMISFAHQKQKQPFLVLQRHFVDAIVVVDSILHKDVTGLSQFCAASSSSSSSHESTCEKWEQASLAWGLATTFHSRWRNTDRHLPVVTHCHDEVLRLAKMFMIQESIFNKNKKNNNNNNSSKSPIIRIMIGVSLPELVAMRLVESQNVFIGNFSEQSATTSSSSLSSLEETRLKLRQDNDSNLENFTSFEVIRNGNLVATRTGEEELLYLSGEAGTPVIQLAIESGVVGGLPCPGFLFGNAFNPYKILRGPEFWNSFNEQGFVHMCVLGAGEVDVYGNVNISDANPRFTSNEDSSSSSSDGDDEQQEKRRNLQKIIGCGGFPDICDGVTFAIVFVVSISSSGTRFQRTAKKSSIVQKVSQISFSPLSALQKSATSPRLVRYCTEFGVFKAELWNDDSDGGKLKSRLVAPPGLELLVQEKCGVRLFL